MYRNTGQSARCFYRDVDERDEGDKKAHLEIGQTAPAMPAKAPGL
jgi:hypothetical protein